MVAVYLSVRISDVGIELLPLINKAFLIWFDDTALDCHRPGSNDIITCHHAHSNPSLLTPPYCIWHLKKVGK